MNALIIIGALVLIALLGVLGFAVFWCVWHWAARMALLTVKCSTTKRPVRVNGVRGVHERKK